MEKYNQYKNSEKWLGQIPKHWETCRMKFLFNEISEKGYPNEPCLCCTQKYGVIPQAMYENRVVVVNKGLENLKFVRKGNFVISLRSFQGGIEMAHYQGIISAAYTILSITNNVVHDGYIKHLFKSHSFIQLLQTCVTGIREGQNINYELLKKQFLPIPHFPEQEEIFSYLDTKVNKIDSYIATTEKKIAALDELKKVTIANAVTHGIHPNVPMKDSGIRWIGQVPEHWVKLRFKDILKEKDEKVGLGKNISLLSLTKNGVIIRDLSEGKGKFPKDYESYKIVHPDDLILCLFDVDETPRTVGIAQNYGMITGAYNIFQVQNAALTYIYYFYLSLDNRKCLKPLYKGLRKVIPLPNLMGSYIFLPHQKEQEEIVSYINHKVAQIDKMRNAELAQIEKLKEYKQRLISDVVTGKVKV